MSVYATILVEQSGPVARLTLNRPEKRNAISFELIDELCVAHPHPELEAGLAGLRDFDVLLDIHLMIERPERHVQDFAAAGGGLVLGICNGFQVLVESGLLPGALLRNREDLPPEVQTALQAFGPSDFRIEGAVAASRASPTGVSGDSSAVTATAPAAPAAATADGGQKASDQAPGAGGPFRTERQGGTAALRV